MRGRKTEILQIHYVFRVFRFLSPTKLNRNELAGYSKAHSIQPLCLAGVVRLWTYTSFEALKVRDSKRLEPVQRYRYYKIIRKHSKKSTPEGCAFKKRKLCMEYSQHLTAKNDGIVSFATFILSFPIISFSSVICLLFKKKFCIIIRAVRPYGNSELMNRVRSGRKQL